MKFGLIVLVLVALIEARPQLRFWGPDSIPQIVGGQISSKGRWPWQLSLQVRGETGFRHTCGASLLSATWALGAAHCVALFTDNPDPNEYRLLIGAFNQTANDAEQIIGLRQIIWHQGFDVLRPGLPDDVSVYELESPADLNNPNIARISLPAEGAEFAGSTRCWISGWGRHDRESDDASPVLREANVRVFTNAECSFRYDDLIDLIPVLDVHVCTGDDNNTIHACHGDSGGPLHCDTTGNNNWVIVGIASRTGPPDCSDYPSVYMRVTSYLQWIRDRVPDV